MATFYRGAGVGTYWHQNDARLSGFQAWDPGGRVSIDGLVRHIARGTTHTPFVSLTLSYGVAREYAIVGRNPPTSAVPGYVYEIQLSTPLPPGLQLYDPVKEIANRAPSSLSGNSYHHDGDPTFLLGVISPTTMGQFLRRPIAQPPPAGGTSRPANLSPQLEAIVRALRDAEILAVGSIPRGCITNRYDVS